MLTVGLTSFRQCSQVAIGSATPQSTGGTKGQTLNQDLLDPSDMRLFDEPDVLRGGETYINLTARCKGFSCITLSLTPFSESRVSYISDGQTPGAFISIQGCQPAGCLTEA